MERPPAEESLIPERSLWLRDGDLRIAWKLAAFVGVYLFVSFFLLPLAMFSRFDHPLLFPVIQASATLAATLFCMMLIEKQSLLDVGLWFRPPALHAFLIGNGAAAGMMVLVFAAELSSGLARTIMLSLEIGASLNIIAFGLLQFGIVAVGEEVLTRGYPFLALQRRYNSTVAIVATSVVFSLMHAANPSVSSFALVNIFLAGIWLGIARVLSGGLWLPIGLHLSWNFVLGSILGYPVSGIVEMSLWRTEVSGPLWITGGYFGPEGGVLVTVVLIAGTLALFHPALRRRYAFAASTFEVQENIEEAS